MEVKLIAKTEEREKVILKCSPSESIIIINALNSYMAKPYENNRVQQMVKVFLNTKTMTKVKLGKWIDVKESRDSNGFSREKMCTCCGCRQLFMNAATYNYCPNCGARMEKMR